MVKIIGDTTSGLPREVAERYGIPIIPQVIHFGETSYLEGLEIDNATFMEKLQGSAELPKTSAPPPELFAREFERLAETGEAALCILPSAVLSGTVRSAQVAAREFPSLDIRIVDTRVIASPVATMLRLAAQWAEAGLDVDTIEARVSDLAARCRLYFLVDTLEYLAKGGRIGGAAALLGSVLQLKPVLTMEDGRIESFEKVRTFRRAQRRLQDLVVEQIAPGEEGHLSVMHAAVPDQAQALVERLQRQLHLSYEVNVLDVPPAIVTHGGPGVLGVGFFTAQVE
ncbi:MAG: DegV family protein [Anaerolineae bacterium]